MSVDGGLVFVISRDGGWTRLGWQLNSENDSRVQSEPWFLLLSIIFPQVHNESTTSTRTQFVHTIH